MAIYDNIIIATIAIIYNLLIHNITSYSYADQQYDEKTKNTISFLFVTGLFAYIVATLFFDNTKFKYNNKLVSSGLKYGGILLVLTAICINWTNVGEELKIIAFGCLFGYLIYYSYKT